MMEYNTYCLGIEVLGFKFLGGLVTCEIAVVGLGWEWRYMLELGCGSLYNTCLNWARNETSSMVLDCKRIRVPYGCFFF